MVAIALIIALGGFLMGFDTSVISGVIGFVEMEFSLSSLELGWSVSSLTLSATLAMFFAGSLSDRYGRLAVLKLAAIFFAVSAVVSALAPSFLLLVLARMLGGLGVGASLIVAPMLIAELAPASERGKLVSFNQFNIVIGISVAFFSNFLILKLAQADFQWVQSMRLDSLTWRWMLGIELLPAVLYFVFLVRVPESPRWLILQNRESEALSTLEKFVGPSEAAAEIKDLKSSIHSEQHEPVVPWSTLKDHSLRLVLIIGLSIGVLQQITGINAVFYYAPMIFAQSGVGEDAAFMQAVLVGLINVVFTVAAMHLIDRLGRKKLLVIGLSGIVFFMGLLSFGFASATYILSSSAFTGMGDDLKVLQAAGVVGVVFDSDIAFQSALMDSLSMELYEQYKNILLESAVNLQPMLILTGILGFVASFAISLGPVMWVLFSELFPNRIRGKAISFVGLVNSAIAFLVTLIFPWELQNLGSATTFLVYCLFAGVGLIIVVKILPETKGKSLEQIEADLVGLQNA
jgi:SP family arabinose:H+ symporter-like MFS transporter